MSQSAGLGLSALSPGLQCEWHERVFLTSTEDRPPLRIGLLLEHEYATPFVAVALDLVARASFCQLQVVLLCHSPPARTPLSWALYERLSRQRRPDLARLFDPVSLAPILDGVARVVASSGTFEGGFVSADTVRTIEALELDVIVHDGVNIPVGPILNAARHGVWSHRYGESGFNRVPPPYFRELSEERVTTAVSLERLSEHADGGVVLGSAVVSTERSFDVLPNRAAGYASGSTLLLVALHRLHCQGTLPATSATGSPTITTRGRNAGSGALELIDYAVRTVGKAVAHRIGPTRKYHWRIGVRNALSDDALPVAAAPYSWIDAPNDRYWADPYVMRHDGRAYLFLEDAPRDGSAARLAVAALDAEHRVSALTTILERPYHLSNPCVFMDRGRHFMIPESGKAGRVELFEAIEFPFHWEPVSTLIDAPARDAVFWRGEKSCFLFLTLREPRWSGPQLWLFTAEEPMGPWRPHPMGPISRDVRYARPAGRPFLWQGRLVRPAQDGSVRYGYALHFLEIVSLDPTHYAERLIHSVYPERLTTPFPGEEVVGVHAFHRQDGLEVIDLQTRR